MANGKSSAGAVASKGDLFEVAVRKEKRNLKCGLTVEVAQLSQNQTVQIVKDSTVNGEMDGEIFAELMIEACIIGPKMTREEVIALKDGPAALYQELGEAALQMNGFQDHETAKND